MSRHPVICKPVLAPLVDPLDYVAWRAGGGNEPPVIIGGSLGVFDDGMMHVITAAQLLALVSDQDGDELTVTGLTVSSVINGNGEQVNYDRAVLVDYGNGTWNLNLADNWRGTVTMILTVTDGETEVSGTVTAGVEHIIWRNDGDQTDNILRINPDGPISSVSDPEGGYRLETVAPNFELFGVRSMPIFIPVSQYDRMRVSWKFDAESGGSFVRPSATFYRAGNEWMTEAWGADVPYGAGSWEFHVPGGAVSLALVWYAFDIPAGQKLWMDDLLLVRLNAAPVVVAILPLPEAAETYTSVWSEPSLLNPFMDPDIDDSLSLQSVSASKGSVVDIGGDRQYTPALGDAGEVTVTVVATDGLATTTYAEIIHVVTKDYRDAEIAWAAGAEWELDPANPYHPLNGETGSTFGLWTPLDLGARLLGWWNPRPAAKLALSGSNVAAFTKMDGPLAVTQGAAIEQPKYVAGASGLNGRPALSYDGGDRLIRNGSTGLPVGGSARSLYVCTKAANTTQTGTVVAQGTVGTPSFRIQMRNQGYPYGGGWGTDICQSGHGPTTAPMISALRYAGGPSGVTTLWKNGVQIAGGNRTFSTDTDLLVFGATETVERFVGLKTDAVWTDCSETTDERQRLEGYIAWNNGLQALLPESNAYKTVRPRVWGAS